MRFPLAIRVWPSVRNCLGLRPRLPMSPTIGGTRIYAIGDVHGRLDCLHALMEQIETDIAEKSTSEWKIIFLGDLVDRGPDSCGVVDYAIALRDRYPAQISFLAGNHEDMLLHAYDGNGAVASQFYRNGGRETLQSYGMDVAEGDGMDRATLIAWMRRHIPATHIEFLRGFHELIHIGDYVFVHAGIRPGVPLEKQMRSDMLWIRAEFLGAARPHPGVIVHGHSIFPEPDRRPNRIGIDTGAFASGKLTALVLEKTHQRFLSAICAPLPTHETGQRSQGEQSPK